MPMCKGESAYKANAFANLRESNASDEAVPGVADAEQTWVASCAEPDLRTKLPREHKVAERDEQLAGSVAVVAVAEKMTLITA
jgi:hypothetical protein